LSRIGKKPIIIPKDAKVEIRGNSIHIEGPLGKLDYPLPASIKASIADGKILFQNSSDLKTDRALYGLTRTLVNNIVIGVTKGHTKELEIQGVGYRAALKGKILNLQLGFSHPVNYPIPEGIKIEVPKPTSIIVKGIDKALVGQVSANIRSFYPPEPYKGKGIRYAGEVVRKKAGKAVTGTK
jgi:large subunit ribosomal protein L6